MVEPLICARLLEGAGAAPGYGLDVERLQQACAFKHVLSMMFGKVVEA